MHQSHMHVPFTFETIKSAFSLYIWPFFSLISREVRSQDPRDEQQRRHLLDHCSSILFTRYSELPYQCQVQPCSVAEQLLN